MSNIDEIKKIYRALGDEQSRMIFIERMLFSITGETSHIENIIRGFDVGRSLCECIDREKKIIVFGAGIWGREIIQIWKAKIEIILDNNKKLQGTKIYDIPVCSPEEFEYKNDIKILICTRLYYEEIYNQLTILGIKEDKIINVGKVLDDLAELQYFDLKELNFSENEIFADVGSLDAMSAVRFINKVDGKFEKVYCFEPDKDNVKKCQAMMLEYIRQDEAEIIQKGVWSSEGNLSFVSLGNGGSSFVLNSNVGLDSVEVTTLDTVFFGKKVTFIKMDIEGAEYEALLGCKNIIMEQKPKLAISIYHKPEDVLEIPKLILQYNPEYNLYIRHYSVAGAETVLYAI